LPLLLLVDGSSYLYRAYHALPDLRTRDGEPTGAIYGVLNMLRRLENEFRPERKVVIFDAPGKTFRNDWFADYKAHRPPMPKDLVSQIKPLHAAIAYHGWPLLVEHGVEADDVIGTLARQATEASMHTLISTGDKDLAQLVNKNVRLINTMSNEMLDTEGVEQKFGVPPDLIIDYLALVGDSSDNIPGVDKCGPKTALKWLKAYGNLDGVIEHAAEIGGIVGENLRHHLHFLHMAKKLLSIRCDVPLSCHVDQLRVKQADKAALAAFYERYQFQSWRRELTGEVPDSSQQDTTQAGTAPADNPQRLSREHYQTILSLKELDGWLAKLTASSLAAIDCETSSLDPLAARLVGLSFAVAINPDQNTTGEHNDDISVHHVAACYIPLAHDAPGVGQQLPLQMVLERLQPWLESPLQLKVGQNTKYDQHVLLNHGINLRGITHDTLLQSCILESNRRHDMDQLAARHLNVTTVPYSELCGKGARQINFAQVDIELASDYAAEDADVTLRLCHAMLPKLRTTDSLLKVYSDIEMPVREVIFAMERTGVHVDVTSLQQYSHELGQKLLQLEAEAYELAGQQFNPGSPQQLAQVLQNMGVPLKKKTPGGAFSTNENVLAELALDYPLPKLLLQHRSLAKLKNTYTDKLPRMLNQTSGRVHTHFSQSVVATGRLASSDPNLQNIPIRTPEGRRIRAAFNAPPGHLIVSADYSQIELRIMAHLSGDDGLLHAFAQGTDIHKATAAEIFGTPPGAVEAEQRRVAKSINFGLIYGMGAFGLARQLGIERAAAQGYIERYFTRYPKVARYMEETRIKARARGYVETLFGRRLWIDDINAKDHARRQGAERAAINAPMQGTAADLIKLSMLAVDNWLENEKLQTRLVLQVHDELLLEAPEEEVQRVCHGLPRCMANVAALKVPLLADVGVGANWDKAH